MNLTTAILHSAPTTSENANTTRSRTLHTKCDSRSCFVSTSPWRL